MGRPVKAEVAFLVGLVEVYSDTALEESHAHLDERGLKVLIKAHCGSLIEADHFQRKTLHAARQERSDVNKQRYCNSERGIDWPRGGSSPVG